MSETRSGLDVRARSRVFAVDCVSLVGCVITWVSERVYKYLESHCLVLRTSLPSVLLILVQGVMIIEFLLYIKI